MNGAVSPVGRRRMMAGLLLIGASMIGGAVLAQEAGAWTYQDCQEVNFNHPDCTQYTTTTTSPASSTSSTVPASSTTSTSPASTSTTSVSTTTLPTSTSTTVAEIGTPVTRQDVTSTTECIQARGCEVVALSNETGRQLPFTGGMTGPLTGLGAVVVAAGAALVGWKRDRDRT